MLVENPEHQLAPLVDILYEAVLVRSDSLPSSLTMWDLLRPDTLVSVSSGSCWGQHTAVSSHISISFKHPLSEPSSGSINNHDIAVVYTCTLKTSKQQILLLQSFSSWIHYNRIYIYIEDYFEKYYSAATIIKLSLPCDCVEVKWPEQEADFIIATSLLRRWKIASSRLLCLFQCQSSKQMYLPE